MRCVIPAVYIRLKIMKNQAVEARFVLAFTPVLFGLFTLQGRLISLELRARELCSSWVLILFLLG